MPRFEPFSALRYATTADQARQLDKLIAPPYDVLSPDDVAELTGRDPHNIVHVDVPAPSSPDRDDRYERAAAILTEWVDAGVLVADAEPTLTIYRMRFTDATGAARDLAGVLGALEVVDDGAGGVLPHERTTPKASTDRLDLTRATRANLSPVWGLSLAAGLSALFADPADAVGAVTVDGVEHIVERVTDAQRIAAICAAVNAEDVLIADGHHRYGVSRIYRDEVRAANGGDAGAAELTLAYIGELVSDQLSVEAIHRLYTGVTATELAATLAESFRLTPIDDPTAATLAAMTAEGFLVLITPEGAQRLDPQPGAFDGVRAIDGAWLEHALDATPAVVEYQHGLTEVADAVESGRATAAVLIRPVSLAEIERTAREGLLMPPKSTFFTPKLRTGFVVRPMA